MNTTYKCDDTECTNRIVMDSAHSDRTDPVFCIGCGNDRIIQAHRYQKTGMAWDECLTKAFAL